MHPNHKEVSAVGFLTGSNQDSKLSLARQRKEVACVNVRVCLCACEFEI
jgi:hypothetical protein